MLAKASRRQVTHFTDPLTFNVLRLISSKDLSEEEHREDKLLLTGKIIKLSAPTRYSRSSNEIDRNIKVIGAHSVD